MTIKQIIESQRGCIENQLRSYTRKVSNDHWLYLESDPDKYGITYIKAFDPAACHVIEVPVYIAYYLLSNDEIPFGHKLVRNCSSPECVNPNHTKLIVDFRGGEWTNSRPSADDWTLPFGWAQGDINA